MYRCVNDIFGYCYRTKDLPSEEIPWIYHTSDGRPHSEVYSTPICKKDPKTCGLFASFPTSFVKLIKKQETHVPVQAGTSSNHTHHKKHTQEPNSAAVGRDLKRKEPKTRARPAG